MTTPSLTFDAIAEAKPGPKWQARFDRSWPEYKAWFLARGGDDGPSRADCEAALREHMPELAPVHAKLTRLAGGGDRAARFLSTWCPPHYLGGCSLAAHSHDNEVRLVRNYDLSPDLNEGLLLRSEWTGKPVMGMVEFLWGVSDGINADGLAVALAYGGRSETGRGFGVTTILRYVLETCTDVEQALAVLERVPSHMAYNIVLADRNGATASVELHPGGGLRRMERSLATNHQHDGQPVDRPEFTKTAERQEHLLELFADEVRPEDLRSVFLKEPLYQRNYRGGFGTLFTADYQPAKAEMTLCWPDQTWHQTLDTFEEGSRQIHYLDSGEADAKAIDPLDSLAEVRPYLSAKAAPRFDKWMADAREGRVDWSRLGSFFSG